MKFGYFIVAVAIVFVTTSCASKNKQEEDPQPAEMQKIASISNGGVSFLEIARDASGNPTIIKRATITLKINYEKNLPKTIDFKVDYRDEVVKYAINYINANEVSIEHITPTIPSLKWLKKASLKFNSHGMLASITKESDGYGKPYTYNYRYNEYDNLVYSELVIDGKKEEDSGTIYENYDDHHNPFYARAKFWSIIDAVARLQVTTYVPFTIAKNNPQKIASEIYFKANKLTYKYDENGFPTEATQQDYNGDTPPKDSDYWPIDGVTKLVYGK